VKYIELIIVDSTEGIPEEILQKVHSIASLNNIVTSYSSLIYYPNASPVTSVDKSAFDRRVENKVMATSALETSETRYTATDVEEILEEREDPVEEYSYLRWSSSTNIQWNSVCKWIVLFMVLLPRIL
jgi:hypothetical protein